MYAVLSNTLTGIFFQPVLDVLRSIYKLTNFGTYAWIGDLISNDLNFFLEDLDFFGQRTRKHPEGESY